MRELLISDARALETQGLEIATPLVDLLHERQATGLVAFVGTRAGVGRPRLAARSGSNAMALRMWAEGYVGFLNGMRDLREPFGDGTVVLFGVEHDGTARCVTYSRRREDCARMSGWADRALFPHLSRIPWATSLGYGNGGIPARLTDAEIDEACSLLSPAQQAAWLPGRA
ncbi:hypothetical protein [Methylobacterium sp. J-090]|uniref:hypothetical protein n=1 Tax=Methylobacterium sp. J-090 TaxID=2836666 RepID=UPI001FBA0918|nr:hypothetical protein [Methylobacterium sp. J-090]MCJ2081545.1 hypothetical protein [Methylobacterium sp. J-090]